MSKEDWRRFSAETESPDALGNTDYHYSPAVWTPVQSQGSPLPSCCQTQGGVCLCAHLHCNRYPSMMPSSSWALGHEFMWFEALEKVNEDRVLGIIDQLLTALPGAGEFMTAPVSFPLQPGHPGMNLFLVMLSHLAHLHTLANLV